MNKEIVKNIEHFIDDGSEIKLSLVMCIWNNSHLLKRSVVTYAKQDFQTKNFEIIIVNDNSEDNVEEVASYLIGKVNYRYIELKHNYGMRGNTMAFNTGFSFSRGEILAETTGETMFTTDMIRKMYEPHLIHDRAFVAIKTYNLQSGHQLQIDSINWQEDVSNLMQLEGFFSSDILMHNYKMTHFGTHQTCSIKKSVFYEIMPLGFPLYGDYGSEDPFYSGQRSRRGIEDITIMQPMAFHQWHPPIYFWLAKGRAPHWNSQGHSTSNYLMDETGQVDQGGTCELWENGSHEPMSEYDKLKWNKLDYVVRATGCNIPF